MVGNFKERMIIECPGCGLKSNKEENGWKGNYNASGECYQKYSELSSYTIGKQDIHFIHQHAIDAYSAQHVGNGMKNITVAFSLIGLYFAVEKKYNGRQVQRIHTLLSRQRHTWEVLTAPEKAIYSLTIDDVLEKGPGDARDKMLREWMMDVWEGWEHQHEWVKNTCSTLLR